MQVRKFIGWMDATGYLIFDKNDAVLIDAPRGTADKIKKYLDQNDIVLKQVIATHAHLDHIADAERLKELTECRLSIHKLDDENQTVINSIFAGKHAGTKFGVKLMDGDTIEFGAEKIKIIHTPGHTPGSICIYNEKENTLFTGDTLFFGTFGRVDFPTGSPADMKRSLKKLGELPKKTVVYPGHGPSTTIERESQIVSA